MIARILDDHYLHAANLLVCVGTLASPAGMIAAGGALVAGTLSLKEIAKRMRPSEKGMAKQIAALLQEQAAKQTHLSGDTAISLPDMVVAGMPSAQTIIDTKQQAKPLIDVMVAHLGTLGQPDYKLSQNITAFRAVLTPVFETLLNDPAFTAHLAPFRERIILEIPEMLREVKADTTHIIGQNDAIMAALAQLQQGANTDTISLTDLQSLATLFGLAVDADKTTLLPLLRDKAIEYAALKSEVDAIPDTMRALSNLKAAAQDAIDRIDLEEVEHLMAMVHETELNEAAKSAEIRANTALLRGKVEDAYRYLSATADSFGAVDPVAPARKRLGYMLLLYDHGLRYGGEGMIHAATINRDAIALLDRDTQSVLWAAAHNDLAVALQDQGIRTPGAEGAKLLAEAVRAYRNALEVYTRVDHPMDWAMTQNNLGNPLKEQGKRALGAEGTDLIAQSVNAHRNALEVYVRADHPFDWAMTQSNLGNALKEQGKRAQATNSTDLLAEAIFAYRYSLQVITHANYPVQWALIQNNLGLALQEQGIRKQGGKGAELLAEALTAYRNAFSVYTRTNHPMHWAATQNNLGLSLQRLGIRTQGAEGARLLTQAVNAYRNALEVTTRADHPVDWAMTQENIAISEKARAAHGRCADPRPPLTAALEAVDNALTIFDPVHLSYNHAKATRLHDEIQAVLDALPPA